MKIIRNSSSLNSLLLWSVLGAVLISCSGTPNTNPSPAPIIAAKTATIAPTQPAPSATPNPSAITADNVDRLKQTAKIDPVDPAQNQNKPASFSLDWSYVIKTDGQKLQLVNTITGAQLPLENSDASAVRGIAFSPDGTKVGGISTSQAQLWSVDTGKQIAVATVQPANPSFYAYPIVALAFNQDQSILGFSGWKGQFGTANFRTGKLTYGTMSEPHTISRITFSPDGNRMALSSQGLIEVRDLTTGKVLTPMIMGPTSTSANPAGTATMSGMDMGNNPTENFHTWFSYLPFDEYSPDGNYHYSLSNANGGSQLVLYGADPSVPVATFDNIAEKITFSPNSLTIAGVGTDKAIHLFDVKSGKPLKTLKGAMGLVISFSYSPDSSLIAVSSDDQNIHVWDAKIGEEIVVLKAGAVGDVMFNAQGTRLALQSPDGTLRIWSARN